MVFFGSLLGGWVSDRVGRRIVIFLPRAALALAAVPVFAAITQVRTGATLVVGVSFLMFLQAMSGAVLIASLPESFPRAVRSLGVAVVYAGGVTVFGGSAQVVAAWLVDATGSAMAPAWYLVATNVVSLCSLYFLRLPRPDEAID